MDNAYYEDLAGRLYGLVFMAPPGRSFTGTKPDGSTMSLDVGEYALALEDMAGMLAHGKIAITGAERGDMLALAGRMKLEGGLVPHTMAACPQAGGDHGAGSR